MTDTSNLGLPVIEAAQAQKHVTHNEALHILDTVVQLAVLDRDLNSPPVSPSEGERWIVKASPSPTGAWTGHGNHVAAWQDGGWQFSVPKIGWLAYAIDENALLAWDGDSWEDAINLLGAELQNIGLLGVGTMADATNPVSAKLNNALWTAKTVAEGGTGDLRYKLSKESASKTLSYLFQDNFSGRAEIGLTGDDDFHFKTSADGSTWVDALLLDKTTGSTKVNSGFFLTGDVSPAQITADQNDYNPTGLSGASVLRLSSDAVRNLTGLAGGADGRLLAIVNVGSNGFVLKDEAASSSAANRFGFGGAELALAAGQSVILIYDGTSSRWRALARSPLTRAVLSGNYPPTSGDEYLLRLALAGAGVLALQNTDTGGYSAITVRGSDNKEYFAAGYGNASAAPIFAGRNYIETWSGISAAGLPKEMVVACDGSYGRTGTVGSPQFYQRATVNHFGMQFWKGISYVNGSEQVKVAEVHEGGHFAIANNTQPNAIDVLPGNCAFWFDKSGGAAVLKVLARDTNGALVTGSLALASALTATASDAFTAADSASAITAGRTADVGGAWAAADSDNWGIVSNKAYRSNGTADSYSFIDTSLSDICIECDVTVSGVRASAGLVVRGVDASNYTLVQLKVAGGNNEINLFKCVAGSFTLLKTLTSAGLTLGQTYALKVGAVGNSIFVYVDNAFKFRVDDSTHKTATRQGLWSYIGAADDDGGTRWDNFKVFP